MSSCASRCRGRSGACAQGVRRDARGPASGGLFGRQVVGAVQKPRGGLDGRDPVRLLPEARRGARDDFFMDSGFSIAGRHIDKFRWIVVAPKDKELHIDVDPLVNHAVSGDRRPLGQGRPARREARADGRHRSVFPDAPHRGRGQVFGRRDRAIRADLHDGVGRGLPALPLSDGAREVALGRGAGVRQDSPEAVAKA
jgi:hypothetical protein